MDAVVVVKIDPNQMSEYVWDEFDGELQQRNWTRFPGRTFSYTSRIDSADTDSGVLRVVKASLDETAEVCGVAAVTGTCVIADRD